MKKSICNLAVLVMLTVPAQAGVNQRITLDGRLNTPYISTCGGTAYLQVSISVPAVESERRQPMNLAVVLDRSGSMADERKIEYAKKAVRELIEQLQVNDIFSFVIYDDVIQVVRDARRVRDMNELKGILEDVYPRGATNLGGGLLEGLHQVERYCGKASVNRVILLSDGLANRGVTDPRELKTIAQRHRSKSISITTMGVGLDFNENLMMSLAENGGGNYYFIESPQSLASIFRKELKTLSGVAVQNAMLELHLGEHVRLNDAIGFDCERHKESVVIALGDLYAGEHRELTLELTIPDGTGSLKVAEGNLRYDGNHGFFESWPSFTAFVRYTSDLSDVNSYRDNELQAKADVAVSTRNVDHALRALDEGRTEEAASEIQKAEATLAASPACSAAGSAAANIIEQKRRLEGFQNLLKDGSDSKKAKKAIQYENYQVQKSR